MSMETLRFIITVLDWRVLLSFTAFWLGYHYCLEQYKRDFKEMIVVLRSFENKLEQPNNRMNNDTKGGSQN